MRVGYCGNFGTPHSTESHVAQALEALGVEVVRWQENQVQWAKLAKRTSDVDFVLWTSTHDYAPPATYPEQRQFLDRVSVPVVSYHLDIWWDLAREHRIFEAPFFRTDLVVTADGGHDDRWEEAKVNHRWMPPAVSEFECELGTPRDEFRSPIAFVGSWSGSYHPEHAHRHELVRWLQRVYGEQCAFWPRRGEHAIRGAALRDLYASVGVLVGDSCFAGKLSRYHSDRIPESLGRGGFLVHPHIDGVTDGSLYTAGRHLATWPVGDWRALQSTIGHYLADRAEARSIACFGRAHVLENHTYTVRMRQLIDLMRDEKLL